MIRKTVHFFIVGALAFALAATADTGSEQARQVLEKTLEREYQDMEMEVTLVKVSKSGRERSMDLTVKIKKTDEATKTLAVFTAPIEVEGITSLSWDYTDPGRESDRWFKLSGMDFVKCRGKACQNMEERFGFSMEIFAIKLDDADHTIAGEGEIDGALCYKVVSTAKDPGNPEGSRFVTWVDKEKYVARRIEVYGQNGQLVHATNFTEFKELGGHWWETKGEMKSFDTGKSLRFEIKNVKVNSGIPDAVFEKPKRFTVEEDEK